MPDHVIVVVDIKGFGRRSEAVQKSLRKELYQALREALTSAGVAPDQCPAPEDRGDGVIWLLPGGVSKTDLTGRFVHRLHAELQTRAGRGESSAMRLRVALHSGEVIPDTRGWVGSALNTACRLLDTPQLREALAAAGPSRLALMVSNEWYEEIASSEDGDVVRATFWQAAIGIKEVRGVAWIHVPGFDEYLEERLQALPDRLTELKKAESDARERHEHAAVRLTGLPDVPLRSDELRLRIEQLIDRDGAVRDRTRMAALIDTCEGEIEQASGEVRQAVARFDRLLSLRDELRGRFEAYGAMETDRVPAEDLELARLRRRAHHLLWYAPCDLAAAEEAVEVYIEGLRRRLGHGGPEGEP